MLVAHFAEDSPAHKKLIKFLQSDESLFVRITAQLTGEGNGYGFTQADLKELILKFETDREHMSEQAHDLEREINARLTEEMLGNEAFIDRLVRKDASLAERILERIKELARAFSTLTNKEARAEYNRLQKAEKLYLKAIEDAGWGYVKGKIKKAEGEERENEERAENDVEYSFKGRAKDGKAIYESNFSKGTPKSAKSQRILEYIKNVWSKKPITLLISNGETSRTILAQFDPTVDESQNIPTDASKLAGGNRHGNHTEQRVTLDLADDYYQIANEAIYNYSKEESGKDSVTHSGVKIWHYFINDIYFAEQGEKELTPYTVTINVKEKDNGIFVYSFNAEKTKEISTRQTLHAAVNTRKGANGELFIDSIPDKNEKVNPKSQKNSGKVSYSMKDSSSLMQGVTEALRREAAKEFPVRKETAENSPKKYANANLDKGYSHKDAQRIINTVVSSFANFGDRYGVLAGKTNQEAEQMLWKGLNTAKPGEQ